MSTPLPTPNRVASTAPLSLWRRWWRQQSPSRQDRYITLGPLFAVVLFLAAVVAAFGYLRIEEIDRERQAVRRDVEYAQQRLRLRLLERQEQLMRIARDVANREVDTEEFVVQATALINQYPELMAVTWVDNKKRVRSAYVSSSANVGQARTSGEPFQPTGNDGTFELARDLRQPVYSRPPDEQRQRRLQHADAAVAGADGRSGQVWRRHHWRILHRRAAAFWRADRRDRKSVV